MDIADGVTVAVDVEAGTVEVEPDTNRQRELRAQADEQLADDTVRGPGATADGHRVGLLHNIGSVDDLDGRVDDDFEGVGLFRTEFLFLDRDTAPTFDEQRQAYEAVLSACGARKVVVRTLDAGADKPLPFLDIDEGPNPALGVRGLRIAKQRPDILDTQLEALAAAAKAVPESNLWVMAPMVATADEAREFANAAHAAGLTTVGVMIEIPAAALLAQRILAEVDFLSIGTNDLAQYTFAADRMEGTLAAFSTHGNRHCSRWSRCVPKPASPSTSRSEYAAKRHPIRRSPRSSPGSESRRCRCLPEPCQPCAASSLAGPSQNVRRPRSTHSRRPLRTRPEKHGTASPHETRAQARARWSLAWATASSRVSNRCRLWARWSRVPTASRSLR